MILQPDVKNSKDYAKLLHHFRNNKKVNLLSNYNTC